MATKQSEKAVTLKNKVTERRLSKTMEHLNTELASSLTTIVRQVRGIQLEHEKQSLEVDSSQVRRRPSTDLGNFDDFHVYQDISRLRSKSFGHSETKQRPKTAGKLKHLSTDNNKSGKAIPKSKKAAGEKSPIQCSPNEKSIHEQLEMSGKSANKHSRMSVDYNYANPLVGNTSAVPRNRRMSLPAIMLPMGDLQKDLDIRKSPKRTGKKLQNGVNGSQETSPEGTTLQLKRLQRELNQRKPKSSRELRYYNLTTAEEKRELTRIQGELSNEFYFGDSDKDYQDKLYRELQNCSYLRRPSIDGAAELSIEDVFK